MFNAVRITLDGKVSAVRESQLLQLDSLRRRVSRAEKQVLEAEQGCQWRQVHGKRRRLANLKFRRSRLEADIAAGRQGFVRRTTRSGKTVYLSGPRNASFVAGSTPVSAE